MITAIMLGLMLSQTTSPKNTDTKPTNLIVNTTDEPKYAFSFITNKLQPIIEIYMTGPYLLKEWDDTGILILSVRRDGSVETSGNLDEASRQFWIKFAQYAGTACKDTEKKGSQ